MAFRQLLDLVLPTECAGCHRAGAPWCRRCARALESLGFLDGPRQVCPTPCPAGLPIVLSWGVYADPLRAAITAWKDEGRRDLEGVLAPLLGGALGLALDRIAVEADRGTGEVLVVPAPSSRRSSRSRGDLPLERLAARAADAAVCGAPIVVAAVLVERRGVRDQAGLGTTARQENVTGAFRVRGSWQAAVRGRACVVVDDVMTTGATLTECARALRSGGARLVVAATVAAAQRRGRRSGEARGTRRRELRGNASTPSEGRLGSR